PGGHATPPADGSSYTAVAPSRSTITPDSHRRATLLVTAVDELFGTHRMRILRTPVRAPRANAIAERWIGTARRELLDRMLILNRHHLMTVLTEYGRTSTTIARTVRSTKQHHLGHYHDRRRHPNITSNDAIHS